LKISMDKFINFLSHMTVLQHSVDEDYPALQQPLLDVAKWTRQEILQRSNMPVQVLKSLYDSAMCTSTCQIHNDIYNATCTFSIINMYLILLHLTESI